MGVCELELISKKEVLFLCPFNYLQMTSQYISSSVHALIHQQPPKPHTKSSSSSRFGNGWNFACNVQRCFLGGTSLIQPTELCDEPTTVITYPQTGRGTSASHIIIIFREKSPLAGLGWNQVRILMKGVDFEDAVGVTLSGQAWLFFLGFQWIPCDVSKMQIRMRKEKKKQWRLF